MTHRIFVPTVKGTHVVAWIWIRHAGLFALFDSGWFTKSSYTLRELPKGEEVTEVDYVPRSN